MKQFKHKFDNKMLYPDVQLTPAEKENKLTLDPKCKICNKQERFH